MSMTTTRLVPSTDERFSALVDDRVSNAETRTLATRDHSVIRQWATRHGAEPATGEATESGGPTIDVNDGGAGIRFNFPGVARFRPITWDEWFRHFERHQLIFVYDEQDSAAARYRTVRDEGNWFQTLPPVT
jgi:hypothetical protein